MSYSIEGIRNFKISNLMDYSGDYNIKYHESMDYIETCWTPKTFIEVGRFISQCKRQINFHR